MQKVKLVNRLGELMAEQELGIQKLCRLAEVSPNTVIKMRRNAARYLDVETTARICKALGVGPGDLLRIEQEDTNT
jgi:DNA-binding Xre family transcriptional regulator